MTKCLFWFKVDQITEGVSGNKYAADARVDEQFGARQMSTTIQEVVELSGSGFVNLETLMA